MVFLVRSYTVWLLCCTLLYCCAAVLLCAVLLYCCALCCTLLCAVLYTAVRCAAVMLCVLYVRMVLWWLLCRGVSSGTQQRRRRERRPSKIQATLRSVVPAASQARLPTSAPATHCEYHPLPPCPCCTTRCSILIQKLLRRA